MSYLSYDQVILLTLFDILVIFTDYVMLLVCIHDTNSSDLVPRSVADFRKRLMPYDKNISMVQWKYLKIIFSGEVPFTFDIMKYDTTVAKEKEREPATYIET